MSDAGKSPPIGFDSSDTFGGYFMPSSDAMAYSQSFDQFISTSSSDDELEIKQKNVVQKILTHQLSENGAFIYFVKKTDASYRNCIWVTEAFLNANPGSSKMLKRYLNTHVTPPTEPLYNPNYEIPEKIIGCRGNEFLVKWTDLDYDQLTWETRESLADDALIEEFQRAQVAPSLDFYRCPMIHPRMFQLIKEVDPSKSGFQARPYQVEGLNFLVNCWFNRRNAILADEMGLGKTLQTALFLKYLYEKLHIHGPFIIIGPLSTIAHWEREFKEWSNLRVIMYYGIRKRRKVIKQYEMFYEGTSMPKFDVFVTTYEYLIKEAEFLSRIPWRCFVIDEAHRLKNTDSKLLAAARAIKTDYKLLLTGTPVQNKLEELWTLLNFLDAEKYGTWAEFQRRFGLAQGTDGAIGLQSVLKPIMLRRMKGDVEKAITPLEEIIIECQMTKHQKAYYKAIVKKNLDYLSRGAHRTNKSNMKNLSMELRKVCNHPYLINGAEEQILIERAEIYPEQAANKELFTNDSLIRTAGKMVLLDKLLTRLKEGNHRVLIFSLMVKMLDILGDYCNYKGYKFLVLDGSVRGEERQNKIDAFNAPNSEYFIFLLMTRAGGVGINLASADTVIIYDSDWNPQNDIQAIARCHRIGQEKDVKAYRFIIANSYERKMFDRASQKLGLDHVVLNSRGDDKMSPEEMMKLLRLGAYHVLEEEDDQNTEQYNEEDIDLILSKSQRIRHELGSGDSTWSKAEFTFDETEVPDVDNPEYWNKFRTDSVDEQLFIPGETIAERRMRDRDLKPSRRDALYADTDDYVAEEGLKGDIDFWTKQKFLALRRALLRYGFDRWEKIAEVCGFSCDICEIRAVSHVILKWLLDETTEKFPAVEGIYKLSTFRNFSKYENKFIKRKKGELEKLLVANVSRSLKRIDLLWHLNRILSTCPDLPNGLVIPEIPSCSVEWWSREDDQALLICVWNDGFQCFENLKLSHPQTPSKDILSARFKALISGYKQYFHRYNDAHSGDLSFNHETVSAALNAWTKKDHKVVVHYLLAYGYPSPEKFREVVGLNNKSLKLIDSYVKTILGLATPEETVELVEPVNPQTIKRIQRRGELLDEIRNLPRVDLSEGDKEIVELVSKTGFLKIMDSPTIRDAFGDDGAEAKLIKYLKALTKKNTERPSKSKSKTKTKSTTHKSSSVSRPSTTVTRHVSREPVSEELPMRLGNSLVLVSLGTIVYDRPAFHNGRYIYPAGFCTERYTASMKDPSVKEWYVSEIVDNGGDHPIFRVYPKNDPDTCFEGPKPSRPWLAVIRESKKGTRGQSQATISGPESFGLAHPVIQDMISRLPNADRCSNFHLPVKEVSDASSEEQHRAPAPPARKPPSHSRMEDKRPLIVDFGFLLERARRLRDDERLSEEVQNGIL